MREEFARLEQSLARVPVGCLAVERHAGEDGPTPFPSGLRAQVDGRGAVGVYQPLPGVQVCLWRFAASRVDFAPAAPGPILAVTHCRLGRVVWDPGENAPGELDPGELALGHPGKEGLALRFPLESFQGASILLSPEALEHDCSPFPGLGSEVVERLLAHLPPSHSAATFPGDPDAACIFDPLYRAPPAHLSPLCALKVQELLLWLARLAPAPARLTPYRAQQERVIRDIHHLLTTHLDRRFTIQELSRRYLINTTSLKQRFKAAYGLPIAAYMKRYRVRRAAQLLLDSDVRIADVASQVGYETQGKFTQAFQDVLGQSPSQYRKQRLAQPNPFPGNIPDGPSPSF